MASLNIKMDDMAFPYCDDVKKYDKLTKIGQGTFGEVFKARERRTGKIVALKKILMENEKEGFPITALREIRILKLLRNENVVRLLEICRSKNPPVNQRGKGSHMSNVSTFYLVFEFCEHDLAGLLSNVQVKFNLGEIKKVLQQLLNGLNYIHLNKILHRDLKASNVLITKTGILKLADFGLARAFSTGRSAKNGYTNRVVTLWYRPPELLLGERNYGPPVDMWGAGCIMAEMWTRAPILQGNSEIHQLQLITKLCGSITPENWANVESLTKFNKMDLQTGQPRRIFERLGPYLKDHMAVDLLDKLLTLDPAKRVDSSTALDHDFFWTDPMPCDLSKMLSVHTQSMFEYLAPSRRPGANRNPMMQQQRQQQQQQTDNISTYQERVY